MLNFDGDCDGHGDADNTCKQAFNCKVSGIQWFKITVLLENSHAERSKV